MRTDREALACLAKGAVSVSEETPCLVPPRPHLILFGCGLIPNTALFRGGVERYSSCELALCRTDSIQPRLCNAKLVCSLLG